MCPPPVPVPVPGRMQGRRVSKTPGGSEGVVWVCCCIVGVIMIISAYVW